MIKLTTIAFYKYDQVNDNCNLTTNMNSLSIYFYKCLSMVKLITIAISTSSKQYF